MKLKKVTIYLSENVSDTIDEISKKLKLSTTKILEACIINQLQIENDSILTVIAAKATDIAKNSAKKCKKK